MRAGSPDGSSTHQANLVLVVDDEMAVRETVAFNLKREGLEVAQAMTGTEAVALAKQLDPDVIVLDVMLPEMTGYEVCRAVREFSAVPILLLSARGEEIDRVVGLEIGADDYLTKPFAMRELVARVRAMLRRTRMVKALAARADDPGMADVAPAAATVAGTETPAPDARPAEATGPVEIDHPRRVVRVRGEEVTLTSKEFDLLAYLVKHPGIVLSREALLREVWGYHHRVDTRTVDVHIRWLRQKIEEYPSEPVLIMTVRGHGYRFVGGKT
ncbi:MAG TPA: response regulator transcription factor [Thermomicrobiales bacterium]|nr:response regulator transcription factor [Thermomicrobiales bacterium]